MATAVHELEQIAERIYNQLSSGKIPEMSIPTRSKNNIIFDERSKVWKYGKSKTTNMAPIANLKISSKKTILCLKIHTNHNGKKLSLTEIFSSGVVNCNNSEKFRKEKIKLEELKDYK